MNDSLVKDQPLTHSGIATAAESHSHKKMKFRNDSFYLYFSLTQRKITMVKPTSASVSFLNRLKNCLNDISLQLKHYNLVRKLIFKNTVKTLKLENATKNSDLTFQIFDAVVFYSCCVHPLYLVAPFLLFNFLL